MKKFKIPTIPSTTNKCIRFPNNVIENVEKAIQGKECTFAFPDLQHLLLKL